MLLNLALLATIPTYPVPPRDAEGANGPADPGPKYYEDAKRYRDPWEDNPDWDYDCDEDVVVVVIKPRAK